MKENENITVSVPEEVIRELKERNIDINELVSSALERRVRLEYSEEELKKGYEEMGEINLGLAESSLEAENEALEKGESYLTESE